jgi:hypothetical protein
MKFANFVLICIAHGNLHHIWAESRKFADFAGLYIFRILQHFAAKLCNFTNFNMLFLAVVMDFVLLA